jgi:hypothetical protein
MHTMKNLGISLLLTALAATPLAAQRNELTLEASFVRGTLGYARHTSPSVLFGIELGFGFPQLDRTLSPEQDPDTGSPDFEEYLHIAPFVRFKSGEHFEVDAGLRASIADLYPCGASDCLPVIFGGAYVQPMVGWRRIKLGARLTGGVVAEGPPDTRLSQGDESTGILSLSPFLVRATFPW